MIRTSLPGIGLSAAVVAVAIVVYGSVGGDGNGPGGSAMRGVGGALDLPGTSAPLVDRSPAEPRDDGDPAEPQPAPVPVPATGGGVARPVSFTQPEDRPTARRDARARPRAGGRRERSGDGDRAARREDKPAKRGTRRGGSRRGVPRRGEVRTPVATPAKPKPATPSPPRRPVIPPVRAGNPQPPGQARPKPAPAAPAPAPAPARPRVSPPGQAAKQAAPRAAAPRPAPPKPAPPPQAAPQAPAAPVQQQGACAPAGNGQGNANGRC